MATPQGSFRLEIFEDGVPPRFRLQRDEFARTPAPWVEIETIRSDGRRQVFHMAARDGLYESLEEVPEPHAFTAEIRIGMGAFQVSFEENEHGEEGTPGHGHQHHDNNMRAAIVHVMADAAVSVLVIIGLLLARAFGWNWMDPLAGIVGAVVIASWSVALIRDTGAVLLDMNTAPEVGSAIRRAVEADGDRVADLHVWRLGPGHLGAIVSVLTSKAREAHFYRLARVPLLSHLTVEVSRR